jgi:hypothetical protein
MKKVTTIYLEQELHDEVKRRGVNLSQLVNTALRAYLNLPEVKPFEPLSQAIKQDNQSIRDRARLYIELEWIIHYQRYGYSRKQMMKYQDEIYDKENITVPLDVIRELIAEAMLDMVQKEVDAKEEAKRKYEEDRLFDAKPSSDKKRSSVEFKDTE